MTTQQESIREREAAMVAPVVIKVSPTVLNWCRAHARSSAIGGISSVRGLDRADSLLEDQLVGQLGNAALSIYLTGSPRAYLQSRWVANRYPSTGDGGHDLIGINVDVKASMMRSSLATANHRLAVRPRERHAGHVYVLALVPADMSEVLLVGWTTDELLPDIHEKDGPFSGAFTVPAWQLNHLPPWKWEV